MSALRKDDLTPYREAYTRTTLTMNDGGVFRESRETMEFVQVGQREPVRGLNQAEPSWPVTEGTILP